MSCLKVSYSVKRGEREYIRKIVDENTIKRLTTAKLLDLPYKEIDIDLDKRWNSKKINAEMLQAIENGESIRDMSGRLQRITNMNKASAMRNARTMTTSFENLGRLDGMKEMQANGTILKKQWLATHDRKTRDAHYQIDGETADIDEPFVNDIGPIMYPGDPAADAANVYNCRCTLTTVVEGFEPSLPEGTIKEVYIDRNLYYSLNNSKVWIPTFDGYDTDRLRACMRAIGIEGSKIKTLSDNEMEQMVADVYKKSSEQANKLRAKYKLPKRATAKQIINKLQNISENEIPSTLNRGALFQKYSLLKLNGDLPDVINDLSTVRGISLYRGVKNSKVLTGKNICDMTKYSADGYVGNGFSGSGTYFTMLESGARHYGTDGFIEAKLKPTAKVIDYADAEIMAKGVDVSIWAVENGYDAIRKQKIYNILRRGCLWIKK